MTMMMTLAKTAVAVGRVRATAHGGRAAPGHGGGLLAALGAVPSGDVAVIDRILSDQGGLGTLLQDLSSDVPARSPAHSDMDNLIAGIGGVDVPSDRALAGFGAVLCSQFDSWDGETLIPNPDQEATAALLIAALVQAARHDPAFGTELRDGLLADLTDVDNAGYDLVRKSFDQQVDPVKLAQQVPPWLEPQVYMISVLGAGAMQGGDAAYLRALAAQMAVGRSKIDMIHDQLGVPRLDIAA